MLRIGTARQFLRPPCRCPHFARAVWMAQRRGQLCSDFHHRVAWLMRGQKRITELLIAFFGRQYFDWWYQFIDKINLASPYHSHWLVRKSVHEALQRGTIKLVRIPTSMIEVKMAT